MILDGKFHPLNVGFRQSDRQGVYTFKEVLNGYEYRMYVSEYLYQDKVGFEHTIKVNTVGQIASYSMSVDLLKTNRQFYEVVCRWVDVGSRFTPLVEHVSSEYRKAMIDEVLETL